MPSKTRRTIAWLSYILATPILVAIGMCITGCGSAYYLDKYKYARGGYSIEMSITSINSTKDLQETFEDVKNHLGDTNRFRVYDITNGCRIFKFIQCYNYPPELPMFSFFCYQKHHDDSWILRGFAPINEYYYTHDQGGPFSAQALNIFNEGEFTKVIYRNALIFSVSTNWIPLK